MVLAPSHADTTDIKHYVEFKVHVHAKEESWTEKDAPLLKKINQALIQAVKSA
jgi:hypothetical protein